MAETYEPEIGSAVTGEAGRAWWRSIDKIPGNPEAIRDTIAAHVEAYKRLGYKVTLDWSDHRDDADLTVKFPHPAKVGPADVDILKGALCATTVKSGWGGSG